MGPLPALTLLLGCQLVGEIAARGLGLPVPGPVLGMLLLLGGLVVHGRVPAALDQVGGTLLGHLSLLFVPAGVGVVAVLGAVEDAAVPILLALVPGTLLAIAVTGWVMARLLRRADDAG